MLCEEDEELDMQVCMYGRSLSRVILNKLSQVELNWIRLNTVETLEFFGRLDIC